MRMPDIKFPHCLGCGLMYTAAALQEGKCEICRGHSNNNIANVFVVLVILAVMAFIIGFCRGETPADQDGLAWSRCFHNGDWRETPYCNAAAGDYNT